MAFEVLRDLHDDDTSLLSHLMLAYAASSDPDTMYLHEAMREPDQEQFLKAMQEEIRGHTENKNWRLVKHTDIPEGSSILPAVWAMKRKRWISTQEVYKWKARLNIDGSKQTKGVNYWETYAPVASWPIIHLILTLSIIKGWHTSQIDFVMAYTQAEAETDTLYMQVPKGYNLPKEKKGTHILKILRNIYGQKQVGRVWNKHLVRKLQEISFKQSAVDECVFYHGSAIYILYTNDSILMGPCEKELDQIIKKMKKSQLDISVDGDIVDFLGGNITRQADSTIHLTQPLLITRILQDLQLDQLDTMTKDKPAKAGELLHQHQDADDHQAHFDFHSIIGKLNYLEKCTHPDISFAVHQCARFMASPKKEHAKAVNWLGCYLLATRHHGLIYKPLLRQHGLQQKLGHCSLH